jgi:hypothetical protein
MSLSFNYRHLYYFWVVAKEGGISRAAERLGIAVQTVSTQVRELEAALGCVLLVAGGRPRCVERTGSAVDRGHFGCFTEAGRPASAGARDGCDPYGLALMRFR